MIRDVVLHMQGDQPMVADLESLPTADDSTLVCTNLRTIDRRKPLTVDHTDSVFIIPLMFIRFIEIPRAAIMAAGLGGPGARRHPALPAPAATTQAASPMGYDEHPAYATEPPRPEEEEDPYAELEPDEELLRRIREA